MFFRLRAGYYSISRGATNFCQLYIFRSGTAHWASVTCEQCWLSDSVGTRTCTDRGMWRHFLSQVQP